MSPDKELLLQSSLNSVMPMAVETIPNKIDKLRWLLSSLLLSFIRAVVFNSDMVHAP